MFARRLALVALLAGVAAFAAVPVSSAQTPGLTKDCKVVSFEDIAKVIGPLVSKGAALTSGTGGANSHWTCGASSRSFGVSFFAICHLPIKYSKLFFDKYSNQYKNAALTWRHIRGLGNEAVFTTVPHDLETNAPSTGFVVRLGGNIFIISGHQGHLPMPVSKLTALTRKALSNNCS